MGTKASGRLSRKVEAGRRKGTYPRAIGSQGVVCLVALDLCAAVHAVVPWRALILLTFARKTARGLAVAGELGGRIMGFKLA